MNQSIGRLADTFHDQRKPNIHRWGRCSARGRSDFPRRTCTLKPPNVARPNHAIDKLPQSLFQSTIEKRTTFNGWINTKKAVRKKAATMVHAKETHDELYKASNHFLTDSDHRSQLENASLTFLRWFRGKKKKVYQKSVQIYSQDWKNRVRNCKSGLKEQESWVKHQDSKSLKLIYIDSRNVRKFLVTREAGCVKSRHPRVAEVASFGI